MPDTSLLEAIDVAEQNDGELIPTGQVRFGLWVYGRCSMPFDPAQLVGTE
jgi:hypothetical protein